MDFRTCPGPLRVGESCKDSGEAGALEGTPCLLRTLNRGPETGTARGTGLVAGEGSPPEGCCAETPEFSHVIRRHIMCRLSSRGDSRQGAQVSGLMRVSTLPLRRTGQ